MLASIRTEMDLVERLISATDDQYELHTLQEKQRDLEQQLRLAIQKKTQADEHGGGIK